MPLEQLHPGGPARRELVGPDAWLVHDEHFLSADEADRALAALLRQVRWEARSIELFGRRILQPRLVGWAGDVLYRYSGQTLPPRAFSPEARALLERVCLAANTSFNHVLFNRYRSGQDSMGMHSDDEPELGDRPVVASLSFGVARRFVIVGKRRSDGYRRELELGHGSLLVMGGDFQRRFRHGIPRQLRVTEERVSATFRRLLCEPGARLP